MQPDSEVIEALFKDLEDEDHTVRETGAYRLGELAAECFQLSRSTLRDDKSLSVTNCLASETTRNAVAQALIKLLCDQDPWVRGNAAEALGKLQDASAVEFLIKASQDEEAIVRFSAVEALGELKAEVAIDALIEQLKDSEWSVRLSAVKALGNIGSVSACDALAKAQKDPKHAIRVLAKEAVAQIQDASRGISKSNASLESSVI